AVRTLCDRAILLRDGRIAADGRVEAVVTEYLADAVKASEAGDISDEATRIGTGEARLVRVALHDRQGRPLKHAFLGQPVTVVLTAHVSRAIPDAVFEVGISTVDGVRVTTSFSTDGNRPPYELEPGLVSISLDLELILLPARGVRDATARIHSPRFWRALYRLLRTRRAIGAVAALRRRPGGDVLTTQLGALFVWSGWPHQTHGWINVDASRFVRRVRR